MSRRLLFRLGAAAVPFTTLVLLTGCFLVPDKNSGGDRSGGGSKLVDRQNIYFDRIGDGRTARIRFKTSAKAHCRLAYYSQDKSSSPSKDDPKKIDCAQSDKPRKEFIERIEGLRTDTLYYVILTVWKKGNKKAQDKVLVKEVPSGSGGGPGGFNGKFQEMIRARFNIPLKTAEVHRHKFNEPWTINRLKQSVTKDTGCRTGVPSEPVKTSEASKDIRIENLATRDFATATAEAHPSFPGRQRLSYGGLNDGFDKWSLLYKIDGRDVRIPIRPVGRILEVEVRSGGATAIEEGSVTSKQEPITVTTEEPLGLGWTLATELLDYAYLTVQIGRADEENAVHCVFPANERSAEIPAKFLDQLPEGRHPILAQLESNVIWVHDGWVITTYDWRDARIKL